MGNKSYKLDSHLWSSMILPILLFFASVQWLVMYHRVCVCFGTLFFLLSTMLVASSYFDVRCTEIQLPISADYQHRLGLICRAASTPISLNFWECMWSHIIWY